MDNSREIVQKKLFGRHFRKNHQLKQEMKLVCWTFVCNSMYSERVYPPEFELRKMKMPYAFFYFVEGACQWVCSLNTEH